MDTELTVNEAVERLHNEHIIVEGHRDCYEQIHRLNERDENPVRDLLLPRLRAGGVDVLLYAIGGDTIAHSNGRDKRLLATIENIVTLRRLLDDPDVDATIVTSASELPARPDGTVRFILHLEGGSPLEGSLAALDAFYDLGVRSVQPAWNVRNELADGVRERRTGGGLTEFGVAVVRRLEELRMVVDLSHISEPGFWQALEVATRPVIVSHANSTAVCDHPRNLTDDQLRAIAETGGVIGAHTLPTYVDEERPEIDRLVDHIEHMIGVAGANHVGIGADFIKSDGPRPGREALYHKAHEVPQLVDLGEMDELPNLTQAMLKRGFSESQVSGILGGNFARVLAQLLP